MIKHIGFAQIQASEGKLDMLELERHFMRVNHCNHKAFARHLEAAWDIWARRSIYQWDVDLGECANTVSTRSEIVVNVSKRRVDGL
jgi:hypothetical protein